MRSALALALLLAVGQWGPDGMTSSAPRRSQVSFPVDWTPTQGVYTSPITVGSIQIPFTRSSSATYEVDGGTVNAIQAPTQLASSPWTGLNSGAGAITAANNAVAAPDGTTTAAQLSLPAVSSAQYSVRGITGTVLPAGSYTWSVQLRAASGTASTYVYAYNNTDGAHLGNSLCSLTSSWSTCSVGFTLVAAKTVNLWLGTDASPGSGMSATSAATVYAWGATLPVAGSVAWAEAGQLRCGYQGCPLEPQRINYLLRSEDISSASWTSYGVVTPTGSTCLGAGGTLTGTRLVTSGGYGSRFQGATTAATTAVVAMLDVSSSTGSAQSAVLEVLWGASDTATCSCEMSDGSSCTVYTIATECYAQTSTSRTTPVHLRLYVSTASTHTTWTYAVGPGTITPGAAGTACVGAADLQVGTHATSHIPTGLTNVTRAADVLSPPTTVIGSAGSIRLDFTPEWASSTTAAPSLIASNSASELSLALGSGVLTLQAHGGSVASSSLGWSAGTAHSVTARWSTSTSALVTDGTTVGGAGGTPSISSLYIGGTSSAGAGISFTRLRICKGRGCP